MNTRNMKFDAATHNPIWNQLIDKITWRAYNITIDKIYNAVNDATTIGLNGVPSATSIDAFFKNI